MTVIYPDHSTAYVEVTRALLAEPPGSASPRDMSVSELRWAQFAVDQPLSFPVAAEGRDFVDAIGVLEACSLVGQFSVPELFTRRVRKFEQFLDGGVFHGSYGARVHGTLIDLVELMRRDADTRQAVLTIYDSKRDLNALKSDIPCTIALQFLSREVQTGPEAHDVTRELEVRTTMRSNDAWLGLPYDLAQFAIMQGTVAQILGQSLGRYVHAVGSLHLYDRDRDAASQIGGPDTGWAPFELPLWDGGRDVAAVSQRARDLCLDRRFRPQTLFESWAHEQLERVRG